MKTILFPLLLAVLLSVAANAQNGSKKFAVLITGDEPGDGYSGQFAIPGSNFDEFWNDTYLMWEMLVTKFGFDNDSVYVLYGSGTDYPVTNSGVADRYKASNANIGVNHITDLSATRSNVFKVFNGLKDGTMGYPKIGEDDMLFVFTFGHGHILGIPDPPYNGILELTGNDTIMDFELATLIDSINANKKVVWMQNCASGDFSGEFYTDNTYMLAGTAPWLTGGLSIHADDCFTYLGSRNCTIPNLENEVISSREYAHGEFIFHLYSAANGKTPDYETYYVQSPEGDFTNVDANNDGYKTLKELFNYVDVQDSQYQPFGPDDPNETDKSLIGDFTSFEYPTLLHDVLNQDMICRGLIGISNHTTLKNGHTLTIKANARVELLDGGDLLVEEGATLIIEPGVEFIKTTSGPNSIEINGNFPSIQFITFNGGNAGQPIEFKLIKSP